MRTNSEDMKIERHPIYLGPHVVALFTLYESPMLLADMWTLEYGDHIADQRVAARQMVAQISEHCSRNFLWELRDAIKDEIGARNAKYGDNHPIDRPAAAQGIAAGTAETSAAQAPCEAQEPGPKDAP